MAEAWKTEENTPNGLYVLHKTYADGPDVFIAVNSVGAAYEVHVSWVTNTEQPDIVKGPFKTLAEAKSAAHAESKEWDSRYAHPSK